MIDVVNQILHLLQTSMMINLRSGNPWFDTGLLIGVGLLTTLIGKYYTPLFKRARGWCRRNPKYAEYTIEGQVMSNATNCERTTVFPQEFKAIMYHLYISKINIKSGRRIENQRHWFDSLKSNSSESVDRLFQYIINTEREIKISDDLSVRQEVTENNNNEKNSYMEKFSLSVISKTKTFTELKDLVDSWTKDYLRFIKEYNNGDTYVFSYVGKDDNPEITKPVFEKTKFTTSRRFDNVFFEGKEQLLTRIDRFNNDPGFYRKKGIPHTLGLLFYGAPGCGKTSTIKAIAQELGRHIIEINLSRVKTCRELKEIFFTELINNTYVPTNRKMIILEDIDCMDDIVKERSLQKDKSESTNHTPQTIVVTSSEKKIKSDDDDDKLTMSFILNLIDGIMEQEGRIIGMTSNHPEVLDKALVRPGRIDIKIHFQKCNHQILVELLRFFYETDDIPSVSDFKEYQFSPAEVYQKCFESATVEQLIEALVKAQQSTPTTKKMYQRLYFTHSDTGEKLMLIKQAPDDLWELVLVCMENLGNLLSVIDTLIYELLKPKEEVIIRFPIGSKIIRGSDKVSVVDPLVRCSREVLVDFYRRNCWLLFSIDKLARKKITQPDSDDDTYQISGDYTERMDRFSRLQNRLRRIYDGKKVRRKRKMKTKTKPKSKKASKSKNTETEETVEKIDE